MRHTRSKTPTRIPPSSSSAVRRRVAIWRVSTGDLSTKTRGSNKTLDGLLSFVESCHQVFSETRPHPSNPRYLHPADQDVRLCHDSQVNCRARVVAITCTQWPRCFVPTGQQAHQKYLRTSTIRPFHSTLMSMQVDDRQTLVRTCSTGTATKLSSAIRSEEVPPRSRASRVRILQRNGAAPEILQTKAPLHRVVRLLSNQPCTSSSRGWLLRY